MSKKLIYSINISLTIIGSIIGAGFASGKEIISFFTKYGYFSIFLCVLSGIGFGVLIYQLLINKNNKFTNANRRREFAFFVCIIIVSGAMLSAVNIISKQCFNSNIIANWITLLVLISVFFVLVHGLRALNIFCMIVVPVVCVFILIICLSMPKQSVPVTLNLISFKTSAFAVLCAISYSAFNVLLASKIIVEYSRETTTKQKLVISLICGVVITTLLLTMNLCFLYSSSNIINSSIPMFVAVNQVSLQFVFFEYIIILLSILTTLYSLAISIKKSFIILYPKFNHVNIFVIFSIIVISLFGFANMVNYAYKVLGVIAIIMFLQKNSIPKNGAKSFVKDYNR